MSSIPQDLLYTKDHEYVKKTSDPKVVLVGITDYAQGELGDIVFLDLPKAGRKVAVHEVFGTFGDGWMIKMKVDPASLGGLMNAAAYKAHLGE